MLCWLRDEEMSVQELLQRLQCVIAHVGESCSGSFENLVFEDDGNVAEGTEDEREREKEREFPSSGPLRCCAQVISECDQHQIIGLRSPTNVGCR